MVEWCAMQRKEYTKRIKPRDASRLTVGIVVSRFNADITERMLKGALEVLHLSKVREDNISIVQVPGSFEIPFGCLKLLKKKKPDAIVALGCIIRGETKHDEYLASAVSHGIIDLILHHRVPISFGVITTNNLAQAKVRSSGKTNKGGEAARAALGMALLSV